MSEGPVSISAGDIVKGLEPTELVEIREVRPFGNGRFLVSGVGVDSRRELKRPLGEEELGRIERVRGADFSFDGDPDAFLLGAEAHRIKIAYQFDPLFAVNSSVVDPLPHQVEAVYCYLLPLPRIRFLLADDTGAGKTIMTGLLMKELLFRGVIQKILIITPGGLTKQWAEEELQEKFGFHTRLLNRGSFSAEPGQFSKYQDGIWVTSIDFIARNETCLRAVAETHWDMIVVDEAHKLSAYEYGAKLEESERYKAVKTLSDKTDHLLFLTATPHRGRKDTFRRLLMLLDPDLFRKDEHVSQRVLEQSESAEDIEEEAGISRARNRFFLRRLKEEMVDWDETPLFKDRYTKTLGYELTPAEKDLYDKVTSYVRSKRREARRQRNQNVTLTLMVMQRRLASSLHAITRTLEKRLQALEDVLEILEKTSITDAERKRLLDQFMDPTDPRSITEYEELADWERDQIDDRIFRQVLTADPKAVREERDTVEELLRQARALKHHKEAKFQELLDLLDTSDVMRQPDEKLLIFTEHKDTLSSLAERLDQKGYLVTTIHGGMDVDRRKQAQREFATKAKIMVATDAAGEGINLQFCRYLINWDIPWNPNRLEQRMGRIHRYGQDSDVWVYNLVAQNTREGAVIEKVLLKLDVMREQMGSDRVYDVIDELLEDVPLSRLIEDAIDAEDDGGASSAIESRLKNVTEERAQKLIDLQRKRSLASGMNLAAARELRDRSDERRLQPLFIEHFFNRAWATSGGTIYDDRNFPVHHLGPTHPAVRATAHGLRRPIPEHSDDPVVFDKKLLSVASKVRVPERTRLLGPGHPVFDALIDWVIRHASDAFARGACLVDPGLGRPQQVWLIRSVVEDGRRDQRIRLADERLALIVEDHMGMRLVSPSYLLECLAPEAEIDAVHLAPRSNDEIQAWSYENLTATQLGDVREARDQECRLRREYLTTAFTDLIVDLETELNDLQQESLFGIDNAEEQEQLRERIQELKDRRSQRLDELELMLDLRSNLPELISHAVVVPAPVATLEGLEDGSGGSLMKRDEEVERIAMDVTMRYERSRGWHPEDVSRDGEHYDIRSSGPIGEKRFIEVKGRARTGAIVLTAPELDKLRQLGERAWLYVVTFCRDRSRRPRLCIIQDPVPKIETEDLYRRIQYVVPEGSWTSAGQEVPTEETFPS